MQLKKMNFEFDGEKYKKASTHQKEWGSKIISEFNFRGNEHILDLGCGDGGLTVQFSELVPQGFVLGIDTSQGMIDEAQKHEKHNLQFKKIDINYLAFKDEFDFVFSNATLHWIKDHNSLLSNVLTSLRPEGIVRFNFAADGNCSNFFKIVRDMITGEEYSRYFMNFEWPWYMPEIQEYKDILKQFPFKETRVWGENADRYFPNAEAMTAWIDQPSLVPFLPYIKEGKRQKFRDDVVERMIKDTMQRDGTCFEIFRRVNLFSRK